MTSKEILALSEELKLNTLSNVRERMRNEDDMPSFLQGFLSPTVKLFSNNFSNFTESLFNSMKDDDNMEKTVGGFANKLRSIENQIIKKFSVRVDGKMAGIQAHIIIEDDTVPYVTTCDAKVATLVQEFAKVGKVLEHSKIYNLKGFKALSLYIEKMLNSETERTATTVSELDKTVEGLIESNKAIETFANKMFNGKLAGTVKIKNIIDGASGYVKELENTIRLTKTVSLGFVNNLKDECERVQERIDYLCSYITDGTIVVSKQVGEKLMLVIETFASFVSNIGLIAAAFIEFLSAMVLIGEKYIETLNTLV